MDEICKRILVQETGLEKLIILFEICGFSRTNEIVDINEKSLNEMEDFICCYLSKKEDVHNYLDNLFFYNLSVFKFAPGLKIKIMKAIKRIQQEYQAVCFIEPSKNYVNDCGSSEISLNIEYNDEMSMNSFKVEKSCMNINLVSPSMSIAEKDLILRKSSNALLNSVSRKYPNVKLLCKKHFDLDIQYLKSEIGFRCTGIFYCYLCPKSNNHSKVIKFGFKKGYRVIVSNVMTHLKHHFLSSDDIPHDISHFPKLLS